MAFKFCNWWSRNVELRWVNRISVIFLNVAIARSFVNRRRRALSNSNVSSCLSVIPLNVDHFRQRSFCYSLSKYSYDDVDGDWVLCYLHAFRGYCKYTPVKHGFGWFIFSQHMIYVSSLTPQKPKLRVCFIFIRLFLPPSPTHPNPHPTPTPSPISTTFNMIISHVTSISWCSSVAWKAYAVDQMWSMLHHKRKLAIHGSGEGGSSWIIGLNFLISSHKETLGETHRISQDMSIVRRV